VLLQYTYIVGIAKKIMDDIDFFHEVCLCNGELRTTMGVFNDSSRYSIIAANSNIATSNNSHAHVEDIMRCFRPASGLGTAIQATTTTTWTSTVVEAGSIAESFLINLKVTIPQHAITLAIIFFQQQLAKNYTSEFALVMAPTMAAPSSPRLPWPHVPWPITPNF